MHARLPRAGGKGGVALGDRNIGTYGPIMVHFQVKGGVGGAGKIPLKHRMHMDRPCQLEYSRKWGENERKKGLWDAAEVRLNNSCFSVLFLCPIFVANHAGSWRNSAVVRTEFTC